MSRVGLVAIGRNEGERLRRCLESVARESAPVVYVDSGSTDGSLGMARSLGAEGVELDLSLPFSAARARNAGVDRLTAVAPECEFVQFLDGDCELRDGWLANALSAIDSRPDVAVVCGRRRERFPDASVYNRLADLEWDSPVGEARSCGGDALVRLDAFRAVGGFDPSVAAGEEPELCQRLRNRGWKILRIDAEMTWHDAAITRFAQWWKRQVRSGYGATDVATRFRQGRDGLFVRQLHSATLWTVGWTALLAVLVIASTIAFAAQFRTAGTLFAIAALLSLVAWPLQAIRLSVRSLPRTGSVKLAFAHGFLTMIAKWGFLLGRYRYQRDRRRGRLTRLIDYKAAGPVPSAA